MTSFQDRVYAALYSADKTLLGADGWPDVDVAVLLALALSPEPQSLRQITRTLSRHFTHFRTVAEEEEPQWLRSLFVNDRGSFRRFLETSRCPIAVLYPPSLEQDEHDVRPEEALFWAPVHEVEYSLANILPPSAPRRGRRGTPFFQLPVKVRLRVYSHYFQFPDLAKYILHRARYVGPDRDRDPSKPGMVRAVDTPFKATLALLCASRAVYTESVATFYEVNDFSTLGLRDYGFGPLDAYALLNGFHEVRRGFIRRFSFRHLGGNDTFPGLQELGRTTTSMAALSHVHVRLPWPSDRVPPDDISESDIQRCLKVWGSLPRLREIVRRACTVEVSAQTSSGKWGEGGTVVARNGAIREFESILSSSLQSSRISLQLSGITL